jgi:Tfp pilus assembly protein PilF
MHLGDQLQNLNIEKGYTEEDEDQFLTTVDWKHDGYELFEISTTAGSTGAFFSAIAESNCFALNRDKLLTVGGFNERFKSLGGGLVNLELFKTLIEDENMEAIVLVGEATFHQVHGGVSTGVELKDHPLNDFKDEYFQLFKRPFITAKYNPFLLGKMHDHCKSLEKSHLDFSLVQIAAGLKGTEDEELIPKILLLGEKIFFNDYFYLFLSANLLKEIGHYDIAKRLYKKCLKKSSFNDKIIQSNLGFIRYMEGSKTEGMQMMKRAVSGIHKDVPAYINLLHISEQEQTWEQSIYYLKKLVELSDNDKKSFFYLKIAINYFKNKAYKQAEYFALKCALYPKAIKAITFYLARLFEENGNDKLASFYYKRFESESDLIQAPALSLYLRLLFNQKKYSKLLRLFRQYEYMLRSNPMACKFAGLALLRQHKVEAAKSLLQGSDLVNQLPERDKKVLSSDDENKSKELLLVLGMHRSGTSSLAGCLQMAGIDAGQIDEYNFDNQKGNRENLEILLINQRLLLQNNLNWNAIGHNNALKWSNEFAEQRDEILRNAFAHTRVWMFKDPRVLICLSFWKDATYPMNFVGTFRNPVSVALSLFTRDRTSMKTGLQLWIDYNLRLLQYYEEAPFPLVCFDLPDAAYKEAVSKAIEFLQDDLFTDEQLDIKKALEFHDSKLKHDTKHYDLNALAQKFDFITELETAQKLYGKLLSLSGNEELLKTTHTPANASHTNELSMLIEGDLAFQNKAFEKAGTCYQNVLESDPNSKVAMSRLISVAKESKNEKLYAQIREDLPRFSEDSYILYLFASLLSDNTLEKATEFVKNSLQIKPDFTEANILAGELAMKTGDLNIAQEYLEKAVTLRRIDIRSLMYLVEINVKMGNWKKVCFHIRRILAIGGINKRANRLFMEGLVEINETEELIEFVLENYDELDTLSPIWLKVAHHFLNRKMELMALLVLDKIKDGNEDYYIQALLMKARILEDMGHPEPAVLYQKQANERRFDKQNYFKEIQLNVKIKNYKKAIIGYNHLLGKNERYNYKIYNLLGSLYLQMNCVDDAASAFKKAISIEAGNWVMYNIGRLHFQKGENVKARQAFEKALELGFNKPNLINKYLNDIK